MRSKYSAPWPCCSAVHTGRVNADKSRGQLRGSGFAHVMVFWPVAKPTCARKGARSAVAGLSTPATTIARHRAAMRETFNPLAPILLLSTSKRSAGLGSAPASGYARSSRTNWHANAVAGGWGPVDQEYVRKRKAD